MSLYKREGYWHYLFYVDGTRYRKSTEIKAAGRRSQQEAEKVMARAITAAEAGEFVKPKKAPVLRDYLKDFVEFVNAMNRAPNHKNRLLERMSPDSSNRSGGNADGSDHRRRHPDDQIP
jgi:thiol:disulfide interchange protein